MGNIFGNKQYHMYCVHMYCVHAMQPKMLLV